MRPSLLVPSNVNQRQPVFTAFGVDDPDTTCGEREAIKFVLSYMCLDRSKSQLICFPESLPKKECAGKTGKTRRV